MGYTALGAQGHVSTPHIYTNIALLSVCFPLISVLHRAGGSRNIIVALLAVVRGYCCRGNSIAFFSIIFQTKLNTLDIYNFVVTGFRLTDL